MICNSCFRRVDPMRSFCGSCGSAVFIEPEQRSRMLPLSGGAAAPRREAPATRAPIPRPRGAETKRARTAGAPATTSVGCIPALVRLAFLTALIWYAGQWLLSIDEVRTLVNALASGVFTDDQLRDASRAVLEHLGEAFGGSR